MRLARSLERQEAAAAEKRATASADELVSAVALEAAVVKAAREFLPGPTSESISKATVESASLETWLPLEALRSSVGAWMVAADLVGKVAHVNPALSLEFVRFFRDVLHCDARRLVAVSGCGGGTCHVVCALTLDAALSCCERSQALVDGGDEFLAALRAIRANNAWLLAPVRLDAARCAGGSCACQQLLAATQ